MKSRPSVLYAMIAFGILVILLLAALIGGLVLAPYLYLTDQVQAAPITSSPVVTEPAGRLSLQENDIIAAYEQALSDVYEIALPSVVNIQVTQRVEGQTGSENQFESPFGPLIPFPQTPEEFYRRGQGSGFVWDTEGHLVTNYHVVEDANDVQVIFANGQIVEAQVLGTDPDSDLAVIQVDLPPSDLQPVVLGDSDDLTVGRLTVAIGNPFGQEFTMTTGIISAVGRTIRSGNSPFSIPEVIQTDAAINPGNSGGPLLNRQGQVIGINTMIISRSGSNAGIGFAIPINIAKQIVPVLIEGETYQYAWLGISGTTLSPEVADFMNLPPDTRGALVIEVSHDSPADEAGLQGSDKVLTVDGVEYQLGGDVITAINDQPVTSMDDLIAYLLEETRPGDKVTLEVVHSDGQEDSVSVTLEARPEANTVQQQNR